MRVHRVYLPHLEPGELRLVGAEAHHLSRVLRVKPGDAVRGFDGRGREAEGRVLSAGDGEVALELGPVGESERESPRRVHLAVALLKADKMSDVVRQGTELGARGFMPFVSARCDVRELSANKLERWRRIAREASKQSGRAVVPEVSALSSLAELARRVAAAPALVADPRAGAALVELDLPETGEMTVITGPEGGFAEDELELLIGAGVRAVRLGPRILRAETAPVALLAALLLPEAL